MKTKTIIKSALLLSAIGIGGCAKHTNEIPAQYVSPMQYSNYSCKQIAQEMAVVSRRVSAIGGEVEKTASNDDVQMGVGLVLFWPTLFFLDGNTPQAAEYARLQGEFDAMEKAAIQKNCNIKIERPVVKPAEAEKKEDGSAFPSAKR